MGIIKKHTNCRWSNGKAGTYRVHWTPATQTGKIVPLIGISHE